jgi:hypothetical protein
VALPRAAHSALDTVCAHIGHTLDQYTDPSSAAVPAPELEAAPAVDDAELVGWVGVRDLDTPGGDWVHTASA